MTDEAFLYDVAFSFLSEDEALAIELNGLLKDRLATFLYSDRERQATLAGRDGEDAFSRVFGKEARTVVVLYRAGWGERGFTSVEATAIRNRAMEHGYDFTMFIPLDKPPIVPKWLPRNRIWIGLERWGIEHAATVIESRVQEAGGNPRELTVADIAQLAIDERRQAGERAAFLNSPEGVQAASREFDSLFDEVQRVCAQSSGLLVNPKRNNILVSMEAPEVRRRVTFHFQLAVSNSLIGFQLCLIEFDGTVESGSNQHSTFHYDFGPSGEQGWREGTQQDTGEFFTTPRFVDDVAKKVLEAIRDKWTNRQQPNFLTW
jgi:hypothetical protein